MKSTDDPYGIGLNEIMRSNKVLLDKVRNMTIDQVVLSIYKMFFYSNTEQLDDEGGENITLEPGKGKKVIDPRNITWFDVPGPGAHAFELIEMVESDIDDDTGITKTLEGEITGKTAFEISQAQQGALKRLNTPLTNIKAALEWDAKLCVSLIHMVYSIPKVYSFVDPELIKEYIASIDGDKERYFVDEGGVFNALKYREFQLSLEQLEDGTFQGKEDKQFFTVKPSYLDWEGEITIRVESMVEMSRPLERQTKLELSNILIPLIGQMAANPALVSAYIKPVKQLLRIYDEEPSQWLPTEWLTVSGLPPGQALPPAPNSGLAPGDEVGRAETVLPESDVMGSTTELGQIQSQSQQLTPA